MNNKTTDSSYVGCSENVEVYANSAVLYSKEIRLSYNKTIFLL